MTILSIGKPEIEAKGPKVAAPDVDDGPKEDYGQETFVDLVKARWPWLVFFCLGLLAAGVVVEEFENVLEKHVELSFFVPLILGHGGNTGSQTISTVLRALALKQIKYRHLLAVIWKETIAGALMGLGLGILILGATFIWNGVSTSVGLVVMISLPIVSMWANGLGAFLTIMASRYKFDPAVTSVPFMTTIVDTTGLIIYFFIARALLDLDVAGQVASYAKIPHPSYPHPPVSHPFRPPPGTHVKGF